MKLKFLLSLSFATLWLIFSIFISKHWYFSLQDILPHWYIIFVISGIALYPGFLMSMMYGSNYMHTKIKTYQNVNKPIDIIICAHNEQENIKKCIASIATQNYLGPIRILIVDNHSTDQSVQIIKELSLQYKKIPIIYLYCEKLGKHYALNHAFSYVETPYFITIDADTILYKNAIQNIMNHIVHNHCACVAGNILSYAPKNNLITYLQHYDYLYSISAIKRFQGSYLSTLVAQGAFSAFSYEAVKRINGWVESQGEDIVLTYRLLQQGDTSLYCPNAVAYTQVPTNLLHLYKQRKRWAYGMLEAFHYVPFYKLKGYSFVFTFFTATIPFLDLAYIFGFLPGFILACFGIYYFVGPLFILNILICILCILSTLPFHRKLKLPLPSHPFYFLLFICFYQIFQSIASIHGYLNYLLFKHNKWY